MDNRIGNSPVNATLRCTADNLTCAATSEHRMATIRPTRAGEKLYQRPDELPNNKRKLLVEGYYIKTLGEVAFLFIELPFRIVGDVAKVLEENYNEFWQKMAEIDKEEYNQRMLNPPPFIDLEKTNFLEEQEKKP